MGKLGEKIAKKRLLNKNYILVEENYHTRFGEIDLIFEDGNVLVFVEVKSRTNLNYGYPEQAVKKIKLRRLMKAAEIYLVKNPQYESWLYRIDVVGLTIGEGEDYFVHYEDVLQ